MARKNLAHIQIDIPQELHQFLLGVAEARGEPIRDILVELIQEEYDLQSHVPNEETRRAIDEVDRGINTTRCRDVEEFIRYMNE